MHSVSKGNFLSKKWLCWTNFPYFDFRVLARKFYSISTNSILPKISFFEQKCVICRSVLCMWVERAEHFVSRKRQLTTERGRMYLCLLHRKKWIEFYYEYARGKKHIKEEIGTCVDCLPGWKGFWRKYRLKVFRLHSSTTKVVKSREASAPGCEAF